MSSEAGGKNDRPIQLHGMIFRRGHWYRLAQPWVTFCLPEFLGRIGARIILPRFLRQGVVPPECFEEMPSSTKLCMLRMMCGIADIRVYACNILSNIRLQMETVESGTGVELGIKDAFHSATRYM